MRRVLSENLPVGTVTEELRFPGLDPATNAVWERLAKVARTRLPVLICGETGTGKELAAEWVHARSREDSQRLVKINCASLSEAVVESELFGHEKGAFTGAYAAHGGIFEAADGGTLFLDEVGELPLVTQAKLLRVLESGELHRVGSTRSRRVSVRLIAATHRCLPERIASGLFREDLYFRINGVAVTIPALRARRCEVLPLANFFVERYAQAVSAAVPEIADCAAHALHEYDWPGNVRELRYVMERAVALSQAHEIRAEHVELSSGSPARTSAPSAPSSQLGKGSIRAHWQRFERERICEALAQTGGNQTKAALLMGISRRTLTNKLNAYSIPRPRKEV